MDDHKVVQLWDKDVEASQRPTPLRRPNMSNASLDGQSSSRQNLEATQFVSPKNHSEEIVLNSSLNPNVKEWFPPNYNRNPEPDTCNSAVASRSVQNRLQKFKPQPEPPNGFDIPEEFHNDPEVSRDISKLRDIICILIEDPGQYDNVIGTFIETLGPYYEDLEIISDTTKLIFEQAVVEPNFRYNAARLCSVIQEQCPIFRSELHLLSKKKIQDNECDSNLALFLAELYTQLNCDRMYETHVIETLRNILNGTAPNVKSVCQVLKLTGASLEVRNETALNEIFEHLEECKNEIVVSSVLNLIHAVIALRASNWGVEQSSPTTTNNRFPSEEPPTSHDGPIFYGPDGKELTEEERQFLSDNCSYQTDFLTDDSDPDGLWDLDPEMDDETQAAYRQFVQESK